MLYLYITQPISYFFCLGKTQAFTFVELFCGTAWVSRVMRSSGKPTAQLDILLTETVYKSSPQNPMDLLSDCGFLFLCGSV